jgi:hypothetical protein
MAAIGLRVPPAFVLGTGWCARQEMITPAMWNGGLAHLERATGLRLGDPRKPLLLSVRSGAPVSMPGMMETLLNIGLSDATLAGIVSMTGNPRLAWDAYRRLVASYGEVVAGVDSRHFDADLAKVQGDRRSASWISWRCAISRTCTSTPTSARPPRLSRNPPTCSFEKPFSPSSDPGTAKRLALTASCTAFRMQWEQQSPFRG